MKKIICIILAIILILFYIPSAVVAEGLFPEHYDYAVYLNMLDLFRGTDIGFELEREPNRLEGAVMFVRLLGAEEEALQQNYPHPFSDVPGWGNPYVGYLYEYGLTKGVSEVEFGSYMPIKAISYLTFALRALGYSDDEPDADFQWNDAVLFAYQNGILSYSAFRELVTEVFLRGHVAYVSFEILGATRKDSGSRLIDKLVAEEAVDEASAAVIGFFPKDGYEAPGLSIGSSLSDTLVELGVPTAILDSRYGFKWLVFIDGSSYLQIGIEDKKVVGILAASRGFFYEHDISIGMTRSELEAAYESEPLDELRKPVPGTYTTYVYSLDNENTSTYLTSANDFITYYFDSYENDVITAFLIIDEDVEIRTLHFFPENLSEAFFNSLGIQVFWINNSFRMQKGLKGLDWSEAAKTAAMFHSMDMAYREYFSHETPEGASLGDRLFTQGIRYVSAGENIAYGYADSVHMVNDWLNSQTGHRETMLGNFNYIGVGVWIDGNGRMYCTQDYWR
ncbi:MAG: CAP-associated domain-containing protein [Clostridia bacterium]|nr:CAP-associated domain-containing protein [Clostridia bacterium]